MWERARGNADLEGMGTTLCAAGLTEDADFAVVNVGDSRPYLLRDGSLRQLTEDHSLTAELVRRGELTEVRGDGWAGPLRSVDGFEGPVAVVVYPWEVALSASTPDGSALNAIRGAVQRITVVGNRAAVPLSPENTISVRSRSLRRSSSWTTRPTCLSM